MGGNGVRDPTEHLVLVCVDDCEHSLLAFDWYYKNFYRSEHTIGLVHIYIPPEIPSFGKHHGNQHDVTDDEEYQRRLQETIKKSTTITNKFQEVCTQKGIVPRTYIEEKVDSIGNTICKLAKESHAKCCILGQRGLGKIKRQIYGSVSEYVLHHAHLAVLIVPPPKKHKCTK